MTGRGAPGAQDFYYEEHEVQTAELSELKRLKDLLKLSPAQAGNQVYKAARQLFSRHRAYLEDTEPNDSKKLLEKGYDIALLIVLREPE